MTFVFFSSLFCFVNVHDGVFAATEPNGFSMLNGVDTMLLVNAVQQVGGVVGSRHLLVVDDVDAGLVQGHRISGGKDAVVFELHGGGMVHAVAVDAHVVHHVDVDDAILLLEIVHHGLRSGSHAFEEAVLVADVFLCPKFRHIEHFHLASGVDVGLAVRTGAADAEVLQCAAVAAHRVTLEVVEGDHEVVVGDMAAHNVVLEVRRVLHGDAHLALLVHDVHFEQGRESVTLDHLPVRPTNNKTRWFQRVLRFI